MVTDVNKEIKNISNFKETFRKNECLFWRLMKSLFSRDASGAFSLISTEMSF